jgi:tRNA dimethylallyltransferase
VARIAVLAGPTASGKTDLAIEVAERLGAEIVSADSQQVYRHFDLGTAKPSAAQLARVPHHLISVVEPTDRMDAARYAEAASVAIAEILARGRRALVVGGTGLYLRALIHGVVPGPGRDEAYRAELEGRAEREGRAALHAELERVDPASAARIEILRVTGRPASQVRAEHGFAEARFDAWGGLLLPPRAELYRRIDRRAEKMFELGLLEETRALADRGFANAPPMSSIGYAEARRVLSGEWTRAEAIAKLAQATRHYAKRQLTWFRKETWLRPLERPEVPELVAELKAFFER